MPVVTFVEHAGTVHRIDAEVDASLMRIAVEHGVPGIVGECGGTCTCGTCHAYVDAAWLDRLPAPTESEAFMLELVPEPRPNSRLCCQLRLVPALDGIVVTMPAEQL